MLKCGDNKLVEIPVSQWPELRDLYKRDWPRHHVSYYTIHHFIDWLQKDPELKNVKIYSLKGDWRDDGTYLIVDRYQVHANTFNDNFERFTTCLECLDPRRRVIFFGATDRIRSASAAYFNGLGSEMGQVMEYGSIGFFMSKEKALQFHPEPPKGMTMRPLNESHAKQIDEAWPLRHPGSLFFVKRLIRLSPNVGAFNEEGELVAWVFRYIRGGLGLLQVRDDQKKRGLGSLVTKWISKKMASEGSDIFAHVVDGNVASSNMFRKLGFEETEKVFRIIKQAASPQDEWRVEDDEE